MTTRETIAVARKGRNSGVQRIKQVGCAFALTMIAGTSIGFAQTGSPSQPDIRNPLGAGEMLGNGTVNVNEHDIVDLSVQDEDLAMVLQMLSIQTQKNIITGKDVSATVTANLYGVTFYEALDAILHANGYGYIEHGNFITIYTQDELKAIEEANRVKTAKIVELNYLNAVDAAAFVQALLSPEGTITTNGTPDDFSVGDTPTGKNSWALGATMVIIDWEENVAAIDEILLQLDTKPVQVLVEAVVLHTTLNEANAWGVDVSVLGSLDYNDFLPLGGVAKAVEGLLTGDGSNSVLRGDGPHTATVQNTGGRGPGTMKFGLVSGDVSVFVRMLDEVSDTKIVSKPNILTLNRQASRVLVGRKVGYLSSTTTQTSTTQSVEFLDTGTQLYFRPFVSKDGMIRMELKPQISEAVIREVTDVTGATVTIPDEITNEITTNVMVQDGQTVVLGGLFRESTTASRRQVPFLGDLPVVGAAFRGNDDATERTEIIFMVTPSIINDKQLIAQADRASEKVRQVRSGFRSGLLPWSREKMTSKLLVEAQRLARDGKTQSALNKIGRSLRLSPNQPDAIALREALMGKESVWPKRHMLDEIVYGEMEAFIDSLNLDESHEEGALPSDPWTEEVQPTEKVTFESEEPEVPFVEAQPASNEFSDEQFGTLTEMTQTAPAPTTGVFDHETTNDEPEEFDAPEVEIFEPGNVEIDTPSEVADASDETPAPVEFDDGRRDFSFADEDIQSVLKTVASEFHKNVIFGQGVSGSVTAQLYDVTFDEAIGAIVLANGLETVDRGSYLEVRSPEVIEAAPAISSTEQSEQEVAQTESAETESAEAWSTPVEFETAVPAQADEVASQENADGPARVQSETSSEQPEWSQSTPSLFKPTAKSSNSDSESSVDKNADAASSDELDALFESTASDHFWADVFWSGWEIGSSHVRFEESGPVSFDPATEDLWNDAGSDPYREYWQTPVVEANDDGNH